MRNRIVVAVAVTALALSSASYARADDAGTVSFNANNPVWPAGHGTSSFVDTTMTYSANAGYTITSVYIELWKVLGANETRVSYIFQTGAGNGTFSGGMAINNAGKYRIKIRMMTTLNNVEQPKVEAVSADHDVP